MLLFSTLQGIINILGFYVNVFYELIEMQKQIRLKPLTKEETSFQTLTAAFFQMDDDTSQFSLMGQAMRNDCYFTAPLIK